MGFISICISENDAMYVADGNGLELYTVGTVPVSQLSVFLYTTCSCENIFFFCCFLIVSVSCTLYSKTDHGTLYKTMLLLGVLEERPIVVMAVSVIGSFCVESGFRVSHCLFFLIKIRVFFL